MWSRSRISLISTIRSVPEHLRPNRRSQPSGSVFCYARAHGIDDKRGHDKSMSAPFQLRPYRAEDEDAAIALWLETWQQAYPAIDFAARVGWWRERWRHELVPNASILVAEQADALIGFVTIDPGGYLDQLVVAPDHWGSALATALLDRAKQLSPARSRCWSTPTTPARFASTGATASCLPVRTPIRLRAGRCCGWCGRVLAPRSRPGRGTNIFARRSSHLPSHLHKRSTQTSRFQHIL